MAPDTYFRDFFFALLFWNIILFYLQSNLYILFSCSKYIWGLTKLYYSIWMRNKCSFYICTNFELKYIDKITNIKQESYFNINIRESTGVTQSSVIHYCRTKLAYVLFVSWFTIVGNTLYIFLLSCEFMIILFFSRFQDSFSM